MDTEHLVCLCVSMLYGNYLVIVLDCRDWVGSDILLIMLCRQL